MTVQISGTTGIDTVQTSALSGKSIESPTITGTLTANNISFSGLVSGNGLTIAANAPAGALQIDASGNLGVGTSSPGNLLHIKGASNPGIYWENSNTGSVKNTIFMDSSGRLVFGRAGVTDWGMFDASGNLLVGTTTAQQKLTVSGAGYFDSSSNVTVLNLRSNSTGSSQGSQVQMTNTYSGATNSTKYIRISDTGNFEIINSAYSSGILSVTNAGAAYQGNNSTTWSTSSDIRLKTNIRDIGSSLNKMMSLHPCHFEYKNAIGDVQTGFIAQEFEAVFPGHVKEEPAAMQFANLIEGDDKTIKTIDANLIPYLVKAIQEQQAMITELKARIEQLENR